MMGNYNVTIEIGNDNAPIQPRRYMQLRWQIPAAPARLQIVVLLDKGSRRAKGYSRDQ